LAAGGRFELHGWSLRGPRGERKAGACRRQGHALADLPPVPVAGLTQAASEGPEALGLGGDRDRPGAF